MMALRSHLKILSFAAVVASSQALHVAERATQRLDSRAPYYGGWALSETSCPSNTTQCTTNHACCPTGQPCFDDFDELYCCPNSKQCIRFLRSRLQQLMQVT